MSVTDTRLAKVHPELAKRMYRIIQSLSTQGITLVVVQGLRTYAEQDAMYAQGRTKPGKRVTNAKGGQSNHNFGLAVDVAPMKAGKIDWNAPLNVWQAIGKAGELEGLEWGGRWKSFVDMPHLQLPGPSVAECHILYTNGGLEAVWKEIKIGENK